MSSHPSAKHPIPTSSNPNDSLRNHTLPPEATFRRPSSAWRLYISWEISLSRPCCFRRLATTGSLFTCLLVLRIDWGRLAAACRTSGSRKNFSAADVSAPFSVGLSSPTYILLLKHHATSVATKFCPDFSQLYRQSFSSMFLPQQRRKKLATAVFGCKPSKDIPVAMACSKLQCWFQHLSFTARHPAGNQLLKCYKLLAFKLSIYPVVVQHDLP